MTENSIIDLPTGVVTFYMDTNEPKTAGKNQEISHNSQLFTCKLWKCFNLVIIRNRNILIGDSLERAH